jgi:choline-glycine betaine transporter
MLALLVPVFGLTSSNSWIIALAIGQLLCIALLSVYISLSKGIKQEVPIIICLMVLYFNLLFYVMI